MRLLRVVVFLSISASLGNAQKSAPPTSSATATATVTNAGKPAKPNTPQKKNPPPQPKKKYLVKVYDLHVDGIMGCDGNWFHFPVTNADKVAKALSFEGYIFNAVAPDQIAIYFSSPSPESHLPDIERKIDQLTLADFNYGESLRVHSATKAVKQLNLLPDGPIIARVVNESCVILLSKTRTPDPIALASIRASLPDAYWHIESTPPVQRLFHLDAVTVAKELAPSSGDKSSSDTSASNTTDNKNTDGKGSNGSQNSSKPAGGTSTGTSSSGTVAQNVAVSVATGGAPDQSSPNQDVAGNNGSPDNTDSSNTNSGNPSVSASAPANKTQSGAAPPGSSPSGSSPAPKPLTMQPVNDMLVYSNEDGSDRGFFERNRLMAVLDLPRPEVLMNIWSLQVSTHDPKIASLEAESANELVSHHNDVLSNAIDQGWGYLSWRMAQTVPAPTPQDKYAVKPTFFEPRFYEYVTQKFAATEDYVNPAGSKESQNVITIPDQLRRRWGWCKPDQYCLGFIHAFEPVRPTLTNILLTIIAAEKSKDVADKTIDAMERPLPGLRDESNITCCQSEEIKLTQFKHCICDEQAFLETLRRQSAIEDCELNDRIVLLDQIQHEQAEGLHLSCFRRQAQESFSSEAHANFRSETTDSLSLESGDRSSTRVGLLRAAVADFLFNYKWATQYPHDFVPYDLTQSAQELNAEFNPLVLAFNRDIKALTETLETELECLNKSRPSAAAWFRSSDETFVNDGILSVRGISGLESVVDTVTQSYFDATNPPNLTDLVNSVSNAEKNTPGVLKTNLTANEAAVLLGALNSVQPTQVKIGRELKLDITPHALAGASSAELDVKLTADEVGNPTRFQADKQTEDTLSRVAKHDVSTRVRVESLKLFDVSAFSAELQRPRSKFPLLPPFFEVPYFGTFLGWPLPGAKVYHRSTAIVSAVIVPTAADLAFGIEFGDDRLCKETGNLVHPIQCNFAHSTHDFGVLPLRTFHKAMVQCFASGGKRFYPGTLNIAFVDTRATSEEDDCSGLSLISGKLPEKQVEIEQPDNSVPPN